MLIARKNQGPEFTCFKACASPHLPSLPLSGTATPTGFWIRRWPKTRSVLSRALPVQRTTYSAYFVSVSGFTAMENRVVDLAGRLFIMPAD